MKRFISVWGPVIIYAAAIFIQSAFPTPIHIPKGWDKVIHFFEFGLLGFLAARVVFLLGNVERWMGIFLGGLTASLWGVLDEFHQSFVPGRYASLVDGVVDGIGAFCGAALFTYLGVFLYKSGKLYPRKNCGME
jgi:VanZ family protein